MLTPNFITRDDVLLIHADQIESFGGTLGLRDEGLLESALAQPKASFAGELLAPRQKGRKHFGSGRRVTNHATHADAINATTSLRGQGNLPCIIPHNLNRAIFVILLKLLNPYTADF